MYNTPQYFKISIFSFAIFFLFWKIIYFENFDISTNKIVCVIAAHVLQY
jgi:hypothetical protein